MKRKLRLYFDLVVIVFFIVFVYLAKDWRLQARLYPWVIGIPMIALAVIHFVRELLAGEETKKPEADSGATPVDFQFSQDVDPRLARARTFNIFGWIFGFFAAIYLLGFQISVPLFVFLYLKVQSREPWPISLGLTAFAWLLFWGLFDWLLKLPFPEGALIAWTGLSR